MEDHVVLQEMMLEKQESVKSELKVEEDCSMSESDVKMENYCPVNCEVNLEEYKCDSLVNSDGKMREVSPEGKLKRNDVFPEAVEEDTESESENVEEATGSCSCVMLDGEMKMKEHMFPVKRKRKMEQNDLLPSLAESEIKTEPDAAEATKWELKREETDLTVKKEEKIEKNDLLPEAESNMETGADNAEVTVSCSCVKPEWELKMEENNFTVKLEEMIEKNLLSEPKSDMETNTDNTNWATDSCRCVAHDEKLKMEEAVLSVKLEGWIKRSNPLSAAKLEMETSVDNAEDTTKSCSCMAQDVKMKSEEQDLSVNLEGKMEKNKSLPVARSETETAADNTGEATEPHKSKMMQEAQTQMTSAKVSCEVNCNRVSQPEEIEDVKNLEPDKNFRRRQKRPTTPRGMLPRAQAAVDVESAPLTTQSPSPPPPAAENAVAKVWFTSTPKRKTQQCGGPQAKQQKTTGGTYEDLLTVDIARAETEKEILSLEIEKIKAERGQIEDLMQLKKEVLLLQTQKLKMEISAMANSKDVDVLYPLE